MSKRKSATPQPLQHPDLTHIRTICNNIVKETKAGRENQDNEVFLFEATMKAMYGEDFFEWYNQQLC